MRYYELLFEAAYDSMITSMLSKYPDYTNAIDWAKQSNSLAKRQDRVVWYLRQLRGIIEAGAVKNKNTVIEKLQQTLDHYLLQEIPKINSYIFSNDKNIDVTFNELKALEKEFHKSQRQGSPVPIKKGDYKLIEYPDGSNWWFVNRAYCKDEGRSGRHCGNVAGRTDKTQRILSYRDKNGSVLLTFILHSDGSLGEMKARYNQKPEKKYHRIILDLLLNDKVKKIKGGGYLSGNNFSIIDLDSEKLDELKQKKPQLFYDNLSKFKGKSILRLLDSKLINDPKIRQIIKTQLRSVSSSLNKKLPVEQIWSKIIISNTLKNAIEFLPKDMKLEDKVYEAALEHDIYDLEFVPLKFYTDDNIEKYINKIKKDSRNYYGQWSTLELNANFEDSPVVVGNMVKVNKEWKNYIDVLLDPNKFFELPVTEKTQKALLDALNTEGIFENQKRDDPSSWINMTLKPSRFQQYYDRIFDYLINNNLLNIDSLNLKMSSSNGVNLGTYLVGYIQKIKDENPKLADKLISDVIKTYPEILKFGLSGEDEQKDNEFFLNTLLKISDKKGLTRREIYNYYELLMYRIRFKNIKNSDDNKEKISKIITNLGNTDFINLLPDKFINPDTFFARIFPYLPKQLVMSQSFISKSLETYTRYYRTAAYKSVILKLLKYAKDNGILEKCVETVLRRLKYIYNLDRLLGIVKVITPKIALLAIKRIKKIWESSRTYSYENDMLYVMIRRIYILLQNIDTSSQKQVYDTYVLPIFKNDKKLKSYSFKTFMEKAEKIAESDYTYIIKNFMRIIR